MHEFMSPPISGVLTYYQPQSAHTRETPRLYSIRYQSFFAPIDSGVQFYFHACMRICVPTCTPHAMPVKVCASECMRTNRLYACLFVYVCVNVPEENKRNFMSTLY